MVSRETILVYVKKYKKPLLILAVAWILTVGVTITTIAILLMTPCDQTPISVQPTTALDDYTFNWSEWSDEVIRGARGRNYRGRYYG